MKTCIIFGAADFDTLIAPIEAEDFVIAADGGLRHTQSLAVSPQAILGDFDSLGYIPRDSRVFPVEKDDTDSMLAIRLGLEKGFRRFLLYGALDGPRLDHTMANFQALAFLSEHCAQGILVGKDFLASVISSGTIRFSEKAAGILSLFCLGRDATVTIQGLQYPLTDGILRSSFPLGVSNHFMDQPASIAVKEGLVLVIWDRSNGLCWQEDLPC